MKTFSIGEYTEKLKNAGMLISSGVTDTEKEIRNLTYDSRAVSADTLFVCKGAAFKEDYLSDAVSNGAVCYVSEIKYESADVPGIIVRDIRKAMPLLADMYYDHPQSRLRITGVGGTKGKSTTAYYIKAILDEFLKISGREKESAVISSIDVYDGKERYESHITTPESMELFEHLRNAADADLEYLTMEVSSQALKYNRVDEIMFDVSIFMNISEDHISPLEHSDFEDYFESKLKIFAQSRSTLINRGADFFERIATEAGICRDVTVFGMTEDCDIYGYDIKKADGEISFRVRSAEFDEPFVLTMPGLFNVENALAAIGTGIIYGIPYEVMYNGLKTARSPGRMEEYASDDRRVIAIVDYAHNKLSFEKLFSSTVKEYPGYDIISIFGCPGKKALLRRRDLGTIAGKYAKKVYLVAEDPGAEPVYEISKDIAQYVEAQNCPYEMIEDRGEAIRRAVLTAKNRSVILITGKGSETRQKYGTEYLDCPSDVEYVKQALAEYNRAKL